MQACFVYVEEEKMLPEKEEKDTWQEQEVC